MNGSPLRVILDIFKFKRLSNSVDNTNLTNDRGDSLHSRFEVQLPFQIGSGSASFIWMSVADFVRADRPSGGSRSLRAKGIGGLNASPLALSR
jgi:hypothetical protein